MTPTSLRIAAIILLFTCAFSVNAEIYRWIDEDGNVRFSDTVPPKASKLERHVLDQQGNLKDVLKRQRTFEELEQHRNRIAALANEKERRAEQEKYDQYLWTTFSGLHELELLRDERLKERDAQIADLHRETDDLKRAEARERARKSNSALAQQNLLRSLQDDIAALELKAEEMEAVRLQEFQGLNKDLERYGFLKLKRAMNKTGP
ncbi:MAG: DUF4124 domain-containing protein [Oceanococcus sp.]